MKGKLEVGVIKMLGWGGRLIKMECPILFSAPLFISLRHRCLHSKRKSWRDEALHSQ